MKIALMPGDLAERPVEERIELVRVHSMMKRKMPMGTSRDDHGTRTCPGPSAPSRGGARPCAHGCSRSPGRAPPRCCRLPRAARARARRPGRCRVFCIRWAVTSSASSSGIPSCSSVTTRLNSRLDGSGASSATTPIAPARLWPARRADARTSRFSGKLLAEVVADACAPCPAPPGSGPIGGAIPSDHPERAEQRLPRRPRRAGRARTDAQTILRGSCLICATSTSSAKPSTSSGSFERFFSSARSQRRAARRPPCAAPLPAPRPAA